MSVFSKLIFIILMLMGQNSFSENTYFKYDKSKLVKPIKEILLETVSQYSGKELYSVYQIKNLIKNATIFKIEAIENPDDSIIVKNIENDLKCWSDDEENSKKEIEIFLKVLIVSGETKKVLYHKNIIHLTCGDLKKAHEGQKTSLSLEQMGFYLLSEDEKNKDSWANNYNSEFAVATFPTQDPLKKYRKNKKILKAVDEGEIYIGMPEDALIVSWGEPKYINETATKYSTLKQFIYSSTYVYTDGKKITSFQSSY